MQLILTSILSLYCVVLFLVFKENHKTTMAITYPAKDVYK